MDNAKEVLDRLKEKYEIIIISMGACPNLFGKEIWIKDNLPSTKFIGIDMKKHKDKSHVDMSGAVLIDDEKRYLDSSKYLIFQFYSDGMLDEITEDELYGLMQTKSIYDKII